MELIKFLNVWIIVQTAAKAPYRCNFHSIGVKMDQSQPSLLLYIDRLLGDLNPYVINQSLELNRFKQLHSLAY